MPDDSQGNSSVTEGDLNRTSDNSDFVTDSSRITTLLQQVMELPPLCSATLVNSDTIFLTSILDIQAENDLIIFDKLAPPSGNNILAKNRSLKLSTVLNGIPLSFDLKDIIIDESQSPVFYTANLPKKIYHPQRRSFLRIGTHSTATDFQGTSNAGKMLLKGYVFDFSRGGIAVNFFTDCGDLLRGDTLTSCLINLPGNQILSFDLSVRSVKGISRDNQKKQIGGYFENLSPQNQKKLDRFISALEREQIRKRKYPISHLW